MARILYFSRDYTPHDHRFLSALAGTNHTVGYLRLEKRGMAREERSLPGNIEVISWRGGKSPARWYDYPSLLAGLQQVIKQWTPDLIHAGPLPSAAFLAAWSRFQPLVSMSWGSDILWEAQHNSFTRWQCRHALKHTTLLAADCQAVLDEASRWGFPLHRSIRFPWGVDLSHYSPASGEGLRRQLGWNDNFVLLSLRSWEPVYGVDIVVKAFAQAATLVPELRLQLLGSGSQAPLITNLIEEYQLQDKIFLGGQVSSDLLPDYYRSADVYVSASHSDGSSVSLMEALACGTPTLVSDIPGNLEWITPGQEGWLFPDGDVQALADGMVKVWQERAAMPSMRLAARRLAEERANWQRNFGVLLEGYQRALDIHGGRA